MANVTLTPVKADKDGQAQVFTSMATADTYFCRNAGRLFIHFKKTGAGAATITFVTQQTINGYAIADQTVAVAATTGDVVVSLPLGGLFNNRLGLIEWSTNEQTGLTHAVTEI